MVVGEAVKPAVRLVLRRKTCSSHIDSAIAFEASVRNRLLRDREFAKE